MAVLKLKPSCKDYIWGGQRLKTEYNKQYDGDRLAETWELSCHADGETLIADGKFAGRPLREYIENRGRQVLGTNCLKFSDFPVLIKLIDAKQDLSVQVHPTDAYALEKEGQYGKTEMWYIAECEKDACLYYGFSREVSREELRRRIQEETILEVLNRVPVRKGDVYFLEAGTVHAIGKGIVIAEIQQNSNVTYRMYDYGRVGADGRKRELHIEKSLDAADRRAKARSKSFTPHLGKCPYFCVDKLVLDGKMLRKSEGVLNEDSFLHLLILDGEGCVCGGEEEVDFRKGDSIFLTAATGAFAICGACEALMTTIPGCDREPGIRE